MKVEVNTANRSRPFPKLMIATKPTIEDCGIIVFFTEERKGVVVYTPNEYRKIGYASDSFIPEVFSDFHGTITLSND